MVVYIITEHELRSGASYVHSVFLDKKKAKIEVDKLNDSCGEDVDYTLESYEVEE
jgi:hypothetical protein